MVSIRIIVNTANTYTKSTEDGTDLGKNLIDGNGCNAFFLFDNASFEPATPAIGLVIDDAVLSAIRKPDPRLVTGGEDSYAGSLDSGGKMHRAAVMPDEYPGAREGGSAFAWSQHSAKVNDTTAASLTPAVGGEFAGIALLR